MKELQPEPCLLVFLIIFDEVGDLGPILLDFLD
jgi:hypothetical protein